MSVLVCLARHATGVVTKERLLEEVWGDSPYVGDDVISHAIWELRKALGDSARDPAYIQTVPRKGYRLIAEILRPQGSPLPMAGVRIDHYDLKEEIGRGAMGVVYEAVDRRLDRTVAIKFLAPDLTRDVGACRRFQREARLAASLDHPNLATVHEIGETSEGHRYIVSPYYRGGSLKDRLAEGPIEIAEALHLTRQLIAGLGAAHERDIVHRDVKPANLLLDEHGTLKICDFGIAKLLGATDLTRTGAPLGTPAYKSPEQTEGREIDHRTDLWSVGVVLFELVTSRRPFGGDYERAVAHSILSREPRILEDARGRPVPEALRGFIARALAKDPEERFQSAEEMVAALDGMEGLAKPSTDLSRWRWGLAAVVAVMLSGLAWWSLRPVSNEVKRDPPLAIVDSGSVSVGSKPYTEGMRLVAQGNQLWLRGNHPENLRQAREHLEKAVDLMPDSAAAMGHLAAFLAQRYAIDKKKQDRDTALEFSQKARLADSRVALARAAEARVLLVDGEVDRAEMLAREAVELDPNCTQTESCDLAYLFLGEVLWRQDKHDDALAMLKRGTQRGSGHIRCGIKRARWFAKLGEKEKAEEEYRRVLDWDEAQVTALNEYSIFLMKAGRLEEAGARLRQLYEQTGDPRTLNNLGYVYYELRLFDPALKVYKRANEAFMAVDIKMPTPLTAIGDIHLELGELEEARSAYEQALVIFDAMLVDDPSVTRRAQRAVCLAKLGRLDDAELEIQQSLERVGDAPEVLYYAGRIYALKGDRETLFDFARQWKRAGGDASRFLDDPAFKPYRDDTDYRTILSPELILAE